MELDQFLRGHVCSSDVLCGCLTLTDYGLEQVVDAFVVMLDQRRWAAFVIGDLRFLAVLLPALFNNALQL